MLIEAVVNDDIFLFVWISYYQKTTKLKNGQEVDIKLYSNFNTQLLASLPIRY